MAYTIDDFWKIWNTILGQSAGLTEALTAIAKSERSVANQLFSNIIDQIGHNSPDYQRLRDFLRDWEASHRTLTTFQYNISDVYQMPNDQLDTLFQSFGFNYSTSLKNPTNNEPLLSKVNFFLDLVNLYKKKGTPQTLVDVLQYYGIGELDVYEFDLLFDDRVGKDPNDLMFKGTIAAGTTGDTSPLYLPYSLLTLGDPHWFLTEAQIRSLYKTNKINFPSRSPYFAVKPLFDEKGLEGGLSILIRKIQDQYYNWKFNSIDPPKDAISTVTGDQISILSLYLAAIYIFNKEYSVGTPGKSFVCYDGTSSDVVTILDEYDSLTGKPNPYTRINQRIKLESYYDTFTRVTPRNFLQNPQDAKVILQALNPDFKHNLDSVALTNFVILGSLLADIGDWLRANISFGFINISYILFGIDSLFFQLRDVIEFFKPYRARLVPLEMVEFSRRLFNTIIVEDQGPGEEPFDLYENIYDYLVGACSTPCCIDSTSVCSLNPREFYDCGSWHDIGSVSDFCRPLEIDFEDVYRDQVNCVPADLDSTAIVTNFSLTDTTTVYYLDSTSGDPFIEPEDYYQSGGFALFDSGGQFDCTHGFDLVNIEVVDVRDFMLTQDDEFLTQEDGSRIVLSLGL